jgi:outer membrane protein assembly factor BamB
MSIESPAATRPLRLIDWLGVIFVAVIWGFSLVQWLLDVETFAGFLWMTVTYLAMTLLFIGWWLTRRSFTWGQRFLVLGCALLLGIVVGVVSAGAIRPPVYVAIFGIPIVLALWALWVPFTAHRRAGFRVGGLIACLALVWSAFLLIRVSGSRGNMRADVHWRWTPTAEEIYLAQGRGKATPTTQPAGRQVELRPGDWPGFRGPNRDGVVRGLSIALDWDKSPPTVLWRQRVGPGWSSMAVVGDCVFTQEQRGPHEAVICRDALDGREIWAHEEPARFDEAMSGPGPRATPTFAGGRIYAQGAMGALDCLDAVTGRMIWSRDVRADAGAAVPMWGFCNSPLLASDRVIVFAGGEGKKGLLAYPLDGGAPVWTADAGKVSYASPQSFEFGTEHQVVMFTSEGLYGVNAASGEMRWQFPIERAVGVPSVVQACQVGPDSFVLGAGAAFGLERVRVAPDGKSVTRAWVTRQMKPSFSDMVYHDGFVYGFDGTVFCCVDAASGTRRWRDGRYGAGQVLLLADQGVMIVSSEDGQAILLRCNSEHNEELGRVPAITGKTWNHPAIAGDRLYIRSDAEMACLQLRPSSAARGG